MASRVETLLNTLDDTEVFFLEYSRIRCKEKAIFIIEGKDDPKFYTSKISATLGNLWNVLSVGGKSKVLELRVSIKNHPCYSLDKVFFMMDKDFDSRILDTDTYTTHSYSIENLYCDPITIRNFVIGECGLSSYKVQNRTEIIEFILDEYKRLRAEFHKNRRLIIANSIFLYIRKEAGAKKTSLDKIIKLEVKIIDNSVKIKLFRKTEYKKIKDSEKTKFRIFLEKSTQLQEILNNPEVLFRGKQEILFLKEFIKLLKDGGALSKTVQHIFDHPLRMENPATAEHILSSMAQYVYSPACLSSFLTSSKTQIYP